MASSQNLKCSSGGSPELSSLGSHPSGMGSQSLNQLSTAAVHLSFLKSSIQKTPSEN